MPTGEALAPAPAVEHLPAHPPTLSEGVRVVTRDEGRYIDFMPSQLSAYLLPPLADCSVLRREAWSGSGLVRFASGSVELEEIGVTAFKSWHELLGGPELALGILAITQHVSDVSSLFGSQSSSRHPLAGITAAPATVALVKVLTPAERLTFTRPTDWGVKGTTPVRSDAPVSELASRIAELSDLGDQRLADLFKVERETFCRWRTGVLSNPRVGNRRRLGLVLALLEELGERKVSIKDWLLNSTTPQGLTPYDLLEQGNIQEVAFIAASIGEVTAVGHEPSQVSDEEPLVFDDDDAWDYDDEDDPQ